MAIDINELGINEAIRYHKPNDPYYWEVDNLPLIDIMRNIVLTAAKINELVIEINNHYDKGEIDSLRTRDLFDVDDVTPGLNDVLKWNGATYTPGPGSNWTYELEDVYNPNPGTNPNASNVEGTVLKWSEVLNPPQFYQSQLELDDIYNVGVPKWDDFWTTSNPTGNKQGDILMYDVPIGQLWGKYVNKQNTVTNLVNVDAPLTSSAAILYQSTDTYGEAIYAHKLAGQVDVTETVMFGQYMKGPINVTSTKTIDSTLIATHMNTTSLPYLSHYIVEAQGYTDNSSHAYVQVKDGDYAANKWIIRAKGNSAGGSDTYNTNQAIVAARGPNTNNTLFLISGWNGIYVHIVGYMNTRRILAIYD